MPRDAAYRKSEGRPPQNPTITKIGATWSVLSEGELARIRVAALDLIEDPGFDLHHPFLLDRARAAGARVAPSGRVRMDRRLVAELLGRSPSRYSIRNVLGQSWEVGGQTPNGTAIVTDPWIIDYASGEPRRPRLEDLRRNTIVAQGLASVSAVSRMDYPVTDVPGPDSSLRALEEHLLNHGKGYTVMPTSLKSFEQWVGIARVLARGGDIRGLVSTAVAVASPLVLDPMNAEILVRAVRAGFPVICTVCPMAGSTSPYSVAGSLLQSHVEALMVVLACQLVESGAPVLYGSGISLTDLRDGHDLYYTLDKVLWKVAGVQLGLAENLPVMAECGGTLTHRCDPQSGAEGMLFMLSALASRAHVLSGFGSCHNAVGMSAEMMVIQNEYLRASRHLGRGIRMDGGRLGVESLRRAGPGGHFLDDELTLDLMRSDEFLAPGLFDASGGRANGRPLLEAAHARVEEMVSGFSSPVPGNVQEALRAHFRRLRGAA